MYLKSLTLKGFKSFAQATTFEFEPGVTAIVGPNGSGKSNVLDGLAWVMGEQGAKTLRGGKMEDVIFAGTQQRGPLGRAEVKLTIDNSDGQLPIEYSEVSISRTLFRNGSSEYAINGENCRLLDVQELLSDSGLGREMHVIVGQGQLDAVLRATPEDRRGFIEEAAGILKHRRRRERTARKLEAMETNLTRLNDLASELRRQLKPLGRQAEVAKQAQTIAAEVRDARARLLADDVSTLRDELHELGKHESERHSERIVLTEQLEQKQLRIERLEQDQHSDDLDRARRVTLNLESVQANLRGLFSQAQQRLTFLASQSDSGEVSAHTSNESLEEAQSEAKRLQELLPAARSAWEEAQSLTQTAQHSLDAIDQHIAEQSALVSKHDLKLSGLRGAVDAAEQKLAAVHAEQERRAHAVEQIETRLRDAQSEQSAFLEAHPESSEEAALGLDDEYQQAQDTQQVAEASRDEHRARVHELEREASALDARISALNASLDQRDASAALIERAHSGLSGRVAEAVTVEPGYEQAIGAALGTFADALLASSTTTAETAVTTAQSDDLGRVRVVVKDAPAGVAGPQVDGLVRAVDVAQAPTGVLGLLARCYIAESLDSARTALTALTESAAGFVVVTSEGVVLTEHTLTGGSSLAPSRIELTADRDQAVARRAQLLGELEAAKSGFDAQRQAADEAKRVAQDAYAQLRQADAQLAEISEKRNRLSVRVEATSAELERAKQVANTVGESLGDAESALQRAQQELEEVAATPRPILDVSERDALADELEQARTAEVEARLAHETAKERATVAERRVTEIAEQLKREEAAAQEAARREVLRKRQISRAERVAEALPDIIDACDRSLTEARVVQQQAEAQRAKHSQELTLLRSEEAELRSRLQSLTERVHNAELKSYERKLSLSSLLERAGAELGLTESILIDEYGPDQPIPVDPRIAEQAAQEQAEAELIDGGSVPVEHEDTSDDGTEGASPQEEAAEVDTVPYVRSEQESRLKKAERKLSELGRINPLALEEFSALEQRHSFLNEQLEDLSKTRKDLMQIIEDLDEKMQVIFADAFADTKEAFAEVFPVLFPGGTGDISLTNPDDMLTTGIEVTAKPAGKKVERLSLLSGGERSLAAVAWLIAIFQARPSPFYILDEVEAALDDANLGRLLQVFSNLRQNSQLIIITHQKRTMEIADALYGVSMRGDGVSAVVGQRIAEAESA